MRRTISLLMMIVMVLAPCAIAHAASSASHHAAITLTSSHVESDKHQHGAPSFSHEQHAECAKDDSRPDHSTCSSNCELLQRATLQDASDRFAAEFKKYWVASAVVPNGAILVLEPPRVALSSISLIERIQDSKSVLRKTARLRL